MSMTDRRTVLQTAAALPFAVAASNTAFAQTPDAAPSAPAKAPRQKTSRAPSPTIWSPPNTTTFRPTSARKACERC